MTAPVLLTPDPRRTERRRARDERDRVAAEKLRRLLAAMGLEVRP